MSSVYMGQQHTARFSELASRIYEGWVVGAVVTDNVKDLRQISPERMASVACDAAAIFMQELRRRDVATGEPIHGQLPQEDVGGYEE